MHRFLLPLETALKPPHFSTSFLLTCFTFNLRSVLPQCLPLLPLLLPAAQAPPATQSSSKTAQTPPPLRPLTLNLMRTSAACSAKMAKRPSLCCTTMRQTLTQMTRSSVLSAEILTSAPLSASVVSAKSAKSARSARSTRLAAAILAVVVIAGLSFLSPLSSCFPTLSFSSLRRRRREPSPAPAPAPAAPAGGSGSGSGSGLPQPPPPKRQRVEGKERESKHPPPAPEPAETKELKIALAAAELKIAELNSQLDAKQSAFEAAIQCPICQASRADRALLWPVCSHNICASCARQHLQNSMFFHYIVSFVPFLPFLLISFPSSQGSAESSAQNYFHVRSVSCPTCRSGPVEAKRCLDATLPGFSVPRSLLESHGLSQAADASRAFQLAGEAPIVSCPLHASQGFGFPDAAVDAKFSCGIQLNLGKTLDTAKSAVSLHLDVCRFPVPCPMDGCPASASPGVPFCELSRHMQQSHWLPLLSHHFPDLAGMHPISSLTLNMAQDFYQNLFDEQIVHSVPPVHISRGENPTFQNV
jgi:hypothetical protein